MRSLTRSSGIATSVKSRAARQVSVSAILAVCGLALAIGCAGPGLPPAGPAPGEVDVGYGMRRASEVAGSLASITEDEVGAAGALTLADLLRGRVPGLQVTHTATGITYRLRGQSSLIAEQAPLFVVNGVPTSAEDLPAAMAGVMMEDVRQIDVLKDVASTSIYGSRGAGGVIIITTRR